MYTTVGHSTGSIARREEGVCQEGVGVCVQIKVASGAQLELKKGSRISFILHENSSFTLTCNIPQL